MAYKEFIVKKIIEIVEIAPKGTSTHYLEGFNQKECNRYCKLSSFKISRQYFRNRKLL